MKLQVLAQGNSKSAEVELPRQFSEEVRPDLIKRAVLAIQANAQQPYGANPRAGLRVSAEISKRRKNYRGSYGHGISRVPRKIMSRRGTRMMWIGAEIPGTVGGRRAHAPKAGTDRSQKINKKENRKAIRSALAATVSQELVKGRGHDVPDSYPFVLDAKFEALEKTKDVKAALKAFGLDKELARVDKKTTRPGKGKLRGRRFVSKKGPLIVVSEKSKLSKSAQNIPGVDIVDIKALNAELLAPGAVPGRLTLFTQGAIEALGKEKLFMY